MTEQKKAGKQPQDRKAKAEKPKVEKIDVKLPDGLDDDGKPKTRTVPGYQVTLGVVTAEFPEEALNDWEFMEDAEDLQRGNASKIVSIARRLFGEGYDALKEEFRDSVTGRVDAEKLSEFVMGVLSANPNS